MPPTATAAVTAITEAPIAIPAAVKPPAAAFAATAVAPYLTPTEPTPLAAIADVVPALAAALLATPTALLATLLLPLSRSKPSIKFPNSPRRVPLPKSLIASVMSLNAFLKLPFFMFLRASLTFVNEFA